MTRAGRVALLTNITEPPPLRPFALSRGSLVSSHLLSEAPAPRDTPFAGFNLLLLVPGTEGFEAEFVSNGGAGGVIQRRAGGMTGGFSNAVDGGEEWDKVAQGKSVFAGIVEGAGDLVEKLFGLLECVCLWVLVLISCDSLVSTRLSVSCTVLSSGRLSMSCRYR